MTTHHAPPSTVTAVPRVPGATLLLAALGFVLFYLGNDFVARDLASSALPLPNAPAEETQAWFTENPLAAVTTGVLQTLSVTCLAGFVIQLSRSSRRPAQTRAVRRATPWGLGAVALMVMSSVIGWVLAAVAPTASVGTVGILRTASFISGGTAHVLALGLFALLASRIPGMTRPIRILAYVAAVPAVLSVTSLVAFEGAAFILLGRLLCMVWTVSAAVSVSRRMAKGAWA